MSALLKRLAVRLLLYALVAFGVWSGGRLSYLQYQSGEACPVLGSVPACYIAFAGYLLMAVSLLGGFVGLGRRLTTLFWTGLLIAGGLALLGSVLELMKGDICPKALGWLPMCYVSFGFSVVIGWLYATVGRQKN